MGDGCGYGYAKDFEGWTMRILAIDPAIASCGFAILEGTEILEFGCLTTSKNDTVKVRLSELYDDVLAIASRWEPDVVWLEEPVFAGMRTTATPVLMAYGVITLALHQSLPTVELCTCKQAQWKKAIIGMGNAKKTDVKAFLMHQYPKLTFKGADDGRDAICIGLYGDIILGQREVA